MLFQEEAGCSYSAQIIKIKQGDHCTGQVAEPGGAYGQPARPKPEPYQRKSAIQCYLQAIGEAHVFTREEEQYYARQLRQGEASARQKMVEHNLRLVVDIAQRYRSSQLSLLERISDGNVGLLYAVEGFDPELGYKFSTYATPWVRQAIERSILVKHKLIRTPYRLARDVKKLKKTQAQLEAEQAKSATLRQLAERLEWSEAKIEALARLEYYQHSLDSEHNEGAYSPHETLASNHSQPCAKVQLKQLFAFINQLVRQLPTLQQSVISLRYGLFDNSTHTLQEVARILGVSRERVRLIQIQVQNRLRRELEQHGLDAQSIFADSSG